MCICGNKDYTVCYHMKNGLPYLAILCTTILCECLHSYIAKMKKKGFLCVLSPMMGTHPLRMVDMTWLPIYWAVGRSLEG